MPENPSADSPAVAASIATVKRYAPPNQRNRSLGRRKSGGDRLERANSYLNDGDRNPLGATKSGPIADHMDSSYSNRANEAVRPKLIPLYGCCNSEAAQLHSTRWRAAMNALNSLPEDSVERPVMYSSKPKAWGQAILPHLLIQSASGAPSDLQRDFLSELRHAMHNANSGPNA
ncbi:iron-stress related protein [Striga asiatica]|uniref:Iron-stress related protein n=1 Tax=Striga asiatica TaxID=4170 RepID=A0A5A7RE94_STRAF|nr:iron-stress related protein [Striga asiatica]